MTPARARRASGAPTKPKDRLRQIVRPLPNVHAPKLTPPPGVDLGLQWSPFARFSIEGLIMNLPTKLAITGLGVAVLMLLAFLTPVDAMAQIA